MVHVMVILTKGTGVFRVITSVTLGHLTTTGGGGGGAMHVKGHRHSAYMYATVCANMQARMHAHTHT